MWAYTSTCLSLQCIQDIHTCVHVSACDFILGGLWLSLHGSFVSPQPCPACSLWQELGAQFWNRSLSDGTRYHVAIITRQAGVSLGQGVGHLCVVEITKLQTVPPSVRWGKDDGRTGPGRSSHLAGSTYWPHFCPQTLRLRRCPWAFYLRALHRMPFGNLLGTAAVSDSSFSQPRAQTKDAVHCFRNRIKDWRHLMKI